MPAAVLSALAVWFVLTGLSVGGETTGPCASDKVMGMTVLGWSWQDFGFVCVANMPDGTKFRYVVRMPTSRPPEEITRLPELHEP